MGFDGAEILISCFTLESYLSQDTGIVGYWQDAESLFSFRVITESGRREFNAMEPKDICTELSVLHKHWDEEDPLNSRSRSHLKAVNIFKRLVLDSNVKRIAIPKRLDSEI